MESHYCMPINGLTKGTFNVLLHMIVLFVFLTIFYKVYVTKLESEKFQSELSSMIDNVVYTASQNATTTTKANVKAALAIGPISKLQERFSQPDPTVEKNNTDIFIQAGLIIGGVALALILMVMTLKFSCKACIGHDLIPLIVETVFTFIFVGSIEYLFFVNIAFKYIPIAPSLITNVFINRIKNDLAAESKIQAPASTSLSEIISNLKNY